jgi:hypothetical protein
MDDPWIVHRLFAVLLAPRRFLTAAHLGALSRSLQAASSP